MTDHVVSIVSSRRTPALLVAVVVLFAAVVTPVAADTSDTLVLGQPDLSVTSPTGPVQASERTTLSVVVSNDGRLDQGSNTRPDYEERVTTARNVRVRIDESRLASDIEVKTGTVAIGRLPSPGSERIDFALELGNVSPGRYRVPITMEYRYTRVISYGQFQQPEFSDLTEEVETSVTLVVEDRAQFAVVSDGPSNVSAGDTGTLDFTIRNTGTRTARQTTVRLSSGSPGLYFGRETARQESTSLYIDEIEPGETRNLTAKVGALSDTSPGTYPVQVNVTFENTNGVMQRADRLRTGVQVLPERTFALRELRTERFRVDEPEARIVGRVVNTGEIPARNVAVQLRTDGPVTATNGEASVGDLAPGESRRVNFTVAIAADAEPGTNTFRFGVEYENEAGELRSVDEPLRKSLTIEPEREPFRVVNVSTGVTAGGSGALSVRIEYVGSEPVRNVNARLFTSDPLSSSDDGAYLGRMRPGDTATATFRVSAAGSALTKEYASSVELRYEEPDGDTRFTDGLSIGVPVGESSGGPPLLPIGGVAGAVLLGLGYVFFRRR